jgi:hypothetical protein
MGEFCAMAEKASPVQRDSMSEIVSHAGGKVKRRGCLCRFRQAVWPCKGWGERRAPDTQPIKTCTWCCRPSPKRGISLPGKTFPSSVTCLTPRLTPPMYALFIFGVTFGDYSSLKLGVRKAAVLRTGRNHPRQHGGWLESAYFSISTLARMNGPTPLKSFDTTG